MSEQPSKRAPWTRRIAEYLSDGEWHDRETVLAVGAAAVPPGRAYREGERMRQIQREEPGARKRGTRETAIATGARTLARQALQGLTGRGAVIVKDGQVRAR